MADLTVSAAVDALLGSANRAAMLSSLGLGAADAGNVSGAVSLDAGSNLNHTLTLTGNVSITVTNQPARSTLVLMLTASGGTRTFTTPSSWLDTATQQTAQVLSIGSGETIVVFAAYNGTSWLWSSQRIAAAQITDATTAGRALLTAADAAAQRSALGLGTAATQAAGSAGGVATLDGGGKVPAAQLPAIAITDVFVVASQAAMLALTAERGDIAIRSDLNKCFALATESPSTLADWKELLTPPNAVLSVAGRTGAVTLVAADISNSTAAGRALLTAADAAAQRTAIGGVLADGDKGDVTVGASGTTLTIDSGVVTPDKLEKPTNNQPTVTLVDDALHPLYTLRTAEIDLTSAASATDFLLFTPKAGESWVITQAQWIFTAYTGTASTTPVLQLTIGASGSTTGVMNQNTFNTTYSVPCHFVMGGNAAPTSRAVITNGNPLRLRVNTGQAGLTSFRVRVLIPDEPRAVMPAVPARVSKVNPSPANATGTTYNYTDPTPNNVNLNPVRSQRYLADGTTPRLRELRLWIPDGLATVRGILVLANAVDSDYRAAANNVGHQNWAAAHGFATLGTKHLRRVEPWDEDISDTPQDGPDWRVLVDGLAAMATASGHPELVNCPFVAMGYSAGGQIAYGLADAAPSRVIAACTNKGGFYNYAKTGVRSVPMIFIAGEADTASRRQNIASRYQGLANQGSYPAQPQRPVGAPWAWIEEANTGHVWGNAMHLLLPFLSECIRLRYPSHLSPVGGQPHAGGDPEDDGWLVEQGHAAWGTGLAAIAPSAGYGGTKEARGWVPSEAIARIYRASASYVSGNSWTSYRKRATWSTPNGEQSEYGTTTVSLRGESTVVLSIDPALAWTAVRIYDGARLLYSGVRAGANSVSVTLRLPSLRPTACLHAEIDHPGGTITAAPVFYVGA